MLPEVAPEGVGLSGDRLSTLTESMQAYVDDGDLAGAIIASLCCGGAEGAETAAASE